MRVWQQWRTTGIILQTHPQDIRRFEESTRIARLLGKEKRLIWNMVTHYRHGQMKGLYWQWRGEAKAMEQSNPKKREAYFANALIQQIPRREVGSSYGGSM
jgi:hypothetical protein